MGSTKPEKKEKKDKSAKRSEVDGVSKSSKTKSDKKDKKEKKDKLKTAVLNAALDDKLQADAAAQSLEKAPEVTEVEVEEEDGEKVTKHVVGALVPFARPLAEEKGTKKILKTVKKGKSFFIPEQIFFFSSSSTTPTQSNIAHISSLFALTKSPRPQSECNAS